MRPTGRASGDLRVDPRAGHRDSGTEPELSEGSLDRVAGDGTPTDAMQAAQLRR